MADESTLGPEFDWLMARAGIAVPADRRDGAIRAYAELDRSVKLIRQSGAATAEPAYVYSLESVLRGLHGGGS